MINVDTFFPIYPEIDSKEMIDNYQKYEFLKEESPKLYPKNKSGLLHTQKFIQKWLSSVTPYDSLFCYHEMGSGKTCAAIAVAEGLFDNFQINKLSKAVFILKNPLLIDSFMNQLIYTCTKDKYNIKDIDGINREIKRKIKTNYVFETYDSITKKLEKMTDSEIKIMFDNNFILVDEVHNLIVDNQYHTDLLQDTLLSSYVKRIKNPQYKQIFRLYHLVQGSKKMIMTGTPIRDKLYQFADVINLILPLERQMPIQQQFISTFLYSSGHKQYLIREEMKNEFKSYLYGIISFVKRYPNPLLTIKYMGKSIDTIFSFPKEIELITTWKHKMSPFQSDAYLETFSSQQGQFFTHSIQAGLCVFPNGSVGESGFKDYIVETTERDKVVYKWNSKMNMGKHILKSIDNLAIYSIKYASIIQNCLDNQTKPTFILFFTVNGSGLILFSLLLEHFGWSRAYGNETKKGKRYAILSASVDSSVSRSQQIIRSFNHMRNKKGEYIQIILGSESVSEGISLYNVQKVHLPQSDWNKTRIDQGIARATRMFSFNVKSTLEIYLHSASTFQPNKDPIRQSIDNYMYNICQEKQIGSKQIERLCKEIAIDCPLFYFQNKTGTKDFSEQCEYQKCEYICDMNPKNIVTPIDYSTYDVFWINESLPLFVSKLQTLFYKQSFVHIEDINGFTLMEKLNCIRECSLKPILFYNSIGIECQLNEFHNILYLSSTSISNEMYWYETHPYALQTKSIFTIWNQWFQSCSIQTLSTFEPYQKIRILKQSPLWIQEMFLEQSIYQNIDKEWFLQQYKKYIQVTDTTIISTLLLSTESFYRIYEQNQWKSTESIQEMKTNVEILTEENIISNALQISNGIYGIFQDSKFLIVDYSTKEKRITEDKREKSRGRVCKTWNKSDLIHFIRTIPISPYEQEELNTKSKQELCSILYNWLSSKQLILS